MRVYISGGITNVPNYMEHFAKAQEKLEAQGYSVINPALVLSNMPKDTSWDEYMRLSIVMLEMSDVAYMMKGWKDSNGACDEYKKAMVLKKKIIFEESDGNGMKICDKQGCGVCVNCDRKPPITNGYSHGDICRITVENIMNHLESGNLYRFINGKLHEVDADVIDYAECDI